MALEVQNIFKKFYFLTVFDQATGATGQVEGQLVMPSTWAVTLKRNF